MSENKPVTDPAWVDPDDAPEWTDEMFDNAELSIGGKVVREAGGALAALETKTERVRFIRAATGRSYKMVRLVAGREMMAASGKTGVKAGKAASKVLKSGSTGKNSKTAAGSALSQRPDKKK